jgi:hypothetical protein
MTESAASAVDATCPRSPKLHPFALKDAPALIEAVFPAQKVSFEAQRERKANLGQTLTAMASHWKGRKPLILVRAIVLGSLLPQTHDAEKDPEVVMANLRDAVVDYLAQRPVLMDMADFIAAKARSAEVRRAAEAIASRIRHQRLQ